MVRCTIIINQVRFIKIINILTLLFTLKSKPKNIKTGDRGNLKQTFTVTIINANRPPTSTDILINSFPHCRVSTGLHKGDNLKDNAMDYNIYL